MIRYEFSKDEFQNWIGESENKGFNGDRAGKKNQRKQEQRNILKTEFTGFCEPSYVGPEGLRARKIKVDSTVSYVCKCVGDDKTEKGHTWRCPFGGEDTMCTTADVLILRSL